MPSNSSAGNFFIYSPYSIHKGRVTLGVLKVRPINANYKQVTLFVSRLPDKRIWRLYKTQTNETCTRSCMRYCSSAFIYMHAPHRSIFALKRFRTEFRDFSNWHARWIVFYSKGQGPPLICTIDQGFNSFSCDLNSGAALAYHACRHHTRNMFSHQFENPSPWPIAGLARAPFQRSVAKFQRFRQDTEAQPPCQSSVGGQPGSRRCRLFYFAADPRHGSNGWAWNSAWRIDHDLHWHVDSSRPVCGLRRLPRALPRSREPRGLPSLRTA